MNLLKQVILFSTFSSFSFLVACSHAENINDLEGMPYTDETNQTIENFSPSLEHFSAQDKAIFGSAFLYAVSGNDLWQAEQLINTGADVNMPDPVNKTPIEIAINNNAADMLRLLLENGALPNYLTEPVSCNVILATAAGGNTRFYQMPLDAAYEKNNAEIIRLLEQAGAKSASKCFDTENAERKLLESLQPVY